MNVENNITKDLKVSFFDLLTKQPTRLYFKFCFGIAALAWSSVRFLPGIPSSLI